MPTIPGKNRRFSLTAYSQRFGTRVAEPAAEQANGGNFSAAAQQFAAVVEECRKFLLEPKGRTEADKSAYHEMINRAVLGFAAERAKALAQINDFLAKKRLQRALFPPQYDTLAEAVFAEVIGFNVLDAIMKHGEEIEEIQVVGTSIYVVRDGHAALSPYRFSSLQDVERIQQNLVLFNRDTFNPRKRWAEVILRDGSRVTLTGFGFTSEPTITIRFYPVRQFDLRQLCNERYETISAEMKDILGCLVRSYFNMVVIGSTNTGKTHLIKALINEMPDHERIVTIESRYELMLRRDFPRKNIVEFEADDDDLLHSGEQAFKLALRQSPRRICQTEIRDSDANLYVRACTRGHDGSLTSVHVNSLEDVPDAITDMCMMNGKNIDPGRLRRRIAEFVAHIGLEMAMVGGKRKLVRIGEYSYEEGEIHVNTIVQYDFARSVWAISGKLSHKAAAKIRRYDEAGFRRLAEIGVLPS